MTVFVFYTKFRDAGELTKRLIELGVVPKCMEPEEAAEPSWRETTDFVHVRVAGSWKNLARAKKVKATREPEERGKPHVHRYLDENGAELLVERAVERSEVINMTRLPLEHASFGNGVTVIDGAMPIAFVVVDPKLKERMMKVIGEVGWG